MTRQLLDPLGALLDDSQRLATSLDACPHATIEARALIRTILRQAERLSLHLDAVREGDAESDAFVSVPANATLEEAEALLIQEALRRCGGNKQQAARALGINVRTIQRRQALVTPGPAAFVAPESALSTDS